MFYDSVHSYIGAFHMFLLLIFHHRSLVDDSTLGPSKLDVLSDAVMDKTALNDRDSEVETGIVGVSNQIESLVSLVLSCASFLLTTKHGKLTGKLIFSKSKLSSIMKLISFLFLSLIIQLLIWL